MSADVEQQYPSLSEVEKMIARWSEMSARDMLTDMLLWDDTYGAASWNGRDEAMTLYKAKLALESREHKTFHSQFDIADLPECGIGDAVFLEWCQSKGGMRRLLYATIPGAMMNMQILRGFRSEPLQQDFDQVTTSSLWLARAAGLASLLACARTTNHEETMSGAAAREFNAMLKCATWTGFPGVMNPIGEDSHSLLPDIFALWDRERRWLREAAWINRNDTHPLAILRTWMLARHFCVSPKANLGECVVGDDWQPEGSLEQADLLDPRWFFEREDSASMADFALAAGAAAGGLPRISSAVNWRFAQRLELVANRPMTESEFAHEEHRKRNPRNVLGWPTDWPIAAPMLARYVLACWGLPWLDALEDSAFTETVQAFEQDPAGYRWIAVAASRSDDHVTRWDRIRALSAVWNRRHSALSSVDACSMGANLMKSRGDINEHELQVRFRETALEHVPLAAQAIVRACVYLRKDEWVSLAMSRLLALAKDDSNPVALQKRAASVMISSYEIFNYEFRRQFRPYMDELSVLFCVLSDKGLRRLLRVWGFRT